MFTSDNHPDDETFRLFAVGRLTNEQCEEIESHLAGCESCTNRLDDIERQKTDPFLRRMKSIHSAKPSGDLEPGSLLGSHFRLEEQLGRGGMGEAWKAFDETVGRYVVLKFVPKDVQHVKEAMDAVLESFRRVHTLQHSHICPHLLLDNDPEHGFFLVMKYIDGLSLDAYSRRNSPIPFDEVIRILRDVADALDYSHNKKVVHRDVKPANIMVGDTDGVQLIDFGLADEIRGSLTRTEDVSESKITGTRAYMAPEQWRGGKLDARTDQYALAVTAYELLAGHVPFSGTDTEILKNAVLYDPPAPIPELPRHVNAALFKGLAKNRNDRFDNCKALVEALARETIPPRLPPPLPSIKPKPAPWKSILPILRVGSVLILSLVTFFATRHFLTPISNTDIPGIKRNLENAVRVGNRQVVVPVRPPNDPSLEKFWQGEPKEKEVEPTASEVSKQPKQPTKSPVLRSPRNEIFNVLRVVMSIGADGTGQIAANRGVSIEPLYPFQGTPFDSNVFFSGMTFRSEIPGVGRVLFPTGHPLAKEPIQPFSLEPVRSRGWECWCSGESYNQARALTRFGMVNNGSRAGFSIGKAGGLPYIVTYEVVDNSDCPPDFELVLDRDRTKGIKSTTISCRWEREEINRLRLSAVCSESPLEGKRIVIADNDVLERGMSLAKSFKLSPDVARNVGMVKCGLWVNQSTQQGKRPGFDLTLLDVVGRFKGNIGFSIEEGGNTAIVGRSEWSNPVPALPSAEEFAKTKKEERTAMMKRRNDDIPLQRGDTILSINGQSGSAATLQKMLDSLNYGDSVTVQYVSKVDGGSRSCRFYAE